MTNSVLRHAAAMSFEACLRKFLRRVDAKSAAEGGFAAGAGERSGHDPPSSPLKKPPGEGTGPTMHAEFRGNLVGRVPSRGERDVFQQTARALARRGHAQ